MFQTKNNIKSAFSSKVKLLPDYEKYVDFFGGTAKGSKANATINEMLEEIEILYNNESLPDIIQILIYDMECKHCRAFLPIWEKLTLALSKRLNKYYSTLVEVRKTVKIRGNPLVIDGKLMTGAMLYDTYNATGVPFILQNFEVEKIKKRGGNDIKMIVQVPFKIVISGSIQPFEILSRIFKIKNRWMDDRLDPIRY